MPFIENISLRDLLAGDHRNPGADAALIRIVGVDDWDLAAPAFPFEHIHIFRFDDLDHDDDPAKFQRRGPQQRHADEILAALLDAHDQGQNVIVHCHAGVSRSGAVALAAELIFGFEPAGRRRRPNGPLLELLLKSPGVEVGFRRI